MLQSATKRFCATAGIIFSIELQTMGYWTFAIIIYLMLLLAFILAFPPSYFKFPHWNLLFLDSIITIQKAWKNK